MVKEKRKKEDKGKSKTHINKRSKERTTFAELWKVSEWSAKIKTFN